MPKYFVPVQIHLDAGITVEAADATSAAKEATKAIADKTFDQIHDLVEVIFYETSVSDVKEVEQTK